jgi:hypothetical protein
MSLSLTLVINDAGEITGKYSEAGTECHLTGTQKDEFAEGEWSHPFGNTGTFKFTLRAGGANSAIVSSTSMLICI